MNTCQIAYPQCFSASLRPTRKPRDVATRAATALTQDEIKTLEQCWDTTVRYYCHIMDPSLTGNTAAKSGREKHQSATSEAFRSVERISMYSNLHRRSWIAEEYPTVASDIEKFRTKKRNWGKTGSRNPNTETLDFAYELLYEIAHCARMTQIIIPAPAVGRCADGSVLFEWELLGRSFELEFYKEASLRRMSFLLCPDEDDEATWQEETITGSISELPAFRTFLMWV